MQALYVLLSLVRNKITVLLIGSAGMGWTDLLCRTLELLSNVTNFGLGLSAVKRLSELHANGVAGHVLRHHIRLIRTLVMSTALLGAFLTLVVAPAACWLIMGSLTECMSFCLLAPAVLLTTLTGGEMAILKGTKQLNRLAKSSVLGAFGTLILSTIFYTLWGIKGVLPAVIGTTAITFLLNLQATATEYPYHIGPFHTKFLRRGIPMLRLGFAYILAGVLTSASELLIRTFMLRHEGGLQMVGYYTAGFTLTVSYARMIFVAMDADYFPQLSAAVQNPREMNLLINRQINTLVVLMAPFLMIFCLFLPLVIRVLYSSEFLIIIPMVLCAASYMYFKAIYTPVAYIPLAKGEARTYMVLEITYDIVFCLLVLGGFYWKGLLGAGIALTLSNLFDLILILSIGFHRYGVRINRSTAWRCIGLYAILAATLVAAAQPCIWLRFVLGALLLLLAWPSVRPVLHQALKRK